MTVIVATYNADGNFVIVRESRIVNWSNGVDRWEVYFWNDTQQDWRISVGDFSSYSSRIWARENLDEIIQREGKLRKIDRVDENNFVSYSGDDPYSYWRIVKRNTYEKPQGERVPQATAWDAPLSFTL